MSTVIQNQDRTSARVRTLLLAIITGLAAACLAYFWLTRQATLKQQAQAAPPVTIMVAAHDIPARTTLTAEMFQAKAIAAAQVPPDAIQTSDDLVGKIAIAPIASGAPVTQGAVAARSVEMGLAYAMPPSARAVTIALDPISGVAGFLKPGDRVDVLATFDAGNGQSVTRTVLQNIPLLAIGSQVLSNWTPEAKAPADGGGAGGAAVSTVTPQEVPNATVMVSPADAQTLVLASTRGKLQLILRPADDTAPVHIPALNSAVVIGASLPKPAPQRAATPPRPTPARDSMPRIEAAFYRRTPQPAPAPAAPAPSTAPVVRRVIKLDGVVLDTNSFAMLSEGNLSYFRKVGDSLAGYRVIKMTENGITMQKPGQPAVLWEIGQKWEE